MGHNFFRTVVGHRDDASPILHQRSRAARNRNQGINADVVRDAKPFPSGVDEISFQFVSRSEGHAVHQDVQLAIALL